MSQIDLDDLERRMREPSPDHPAGTEVTEEELKLIKELWRLMAEYDDRLSARDSAAPQIDIHPRHHSHQYELKPMSRWWLVPILGYAALCLFAMGPTNWQAYACILAGIFIGMGQILIFPRYWLSRLE